MPANDIQQREQALLDELIAAFGDHVVITPHHESAAFGTGRCVRMGQPGSAHEGASRELVDDPDETLVVRPEECRKCGHDFTGQGRVVGGAARHQVIDLPESAVLTTEHRLLKVAYPRVRDAYLCRAACGC